MMLSTLLATVLAVQAKPEVSVTVNFKPDTNGKSGSGTVVVSFGEGWHAYQNPPKSEYDTPLTVASATKGFKLTEVKYPAGQPLPDKEDTLVYEGKVEVPFKATLGKELKPKKGKYEVAVKVGYQICNASTCLPPTSVEGKFSWVTK